ncbi:plasmid replication DNA-binding protein KfrA [Paraburkholderia sp. BL6665CI2N2]|uniref:DNA-binding protein n=1 Tax=Paraburkholderia sp. BL6665CI2N2 TaxID=1938806 RepID=UPI0010664CEE|nr:DNA-binding protein [Paraburkholderia sp. BL6665CI2N2]TDY23497.1 plasmid replication DNA-binding protein KfrA [Paraburkholderia sp. BL6665CI2N2]
MARPAAVTPDQIRTTVLAMLAEAGDAASAAPATQATRATSVTPATPVTRERFRRAVSVRRLRARLGAGDPAMLSRALNAIEAELVQAGLAEVALPGLPDAIAAQMRALWAAAVSVQLDDVVRLRLHAQQATADAQTARHDADVRSEMLRIELGELRERLTARDAELTELRASSRHAAEGAQRLADETAALQTQLDTARTTLESLRHTHVTELADARSRYDGLSKRLLQETEHQRHALAAERERLATQFADAQTRITALEGLRERLLEELATERDAHRQAAAGAVALATVVAEQRHALQALQTLQARPAAHATQSAAQKRPARHPPARHAGPGHAAAIAAAPRARSRASRTRKSPTS